LTVTFTASGACSVNGTALTYTGAGLCTINANQAGNNSWQAAPQVTQTVTVNQATLTITASSPSAIAYGAAVPTITASYVGFVGTDNQWKSFFTRPACSTTYTTTSAPGSYPTTCSGAVDASGNYSITPAAGTFTVNKAAQTFTHWYDSSTVYGTPVTLSAVASSGLTVSYSVISGPGSITSGSTLTPSGAGAIVVAANLAGNGNYTAATQVTHTVTVYQAPLVITASSPSAITYGAAPPTVTPTYATWVNGDGAGSLSTAPTCFTPTYTTTSAPGNYTTVCYGASDAKYSISYVSGSLTVNKAPASVSVWPTTSGSIVYGAALSTSTLNGGTATTPGTFAWTNPGYIPKVGGLAQSVTFTPTSSADYTAVVGSASITVTQATPTISTSPTASAIPYNALLSASILSGGVTNATGGGTFTWTCLSSSCTAPPLMGANTLQSVTFSPKDTTDYTTQTTTVSVTVNKATPTISVWPTPSAITYGAALSTSTLTGGSASVPGTAGPASTGFAWANPSIIPAAGSSVAESVTFTPSDATHYSTTTGTVHLVVNAQPATVRTWPTASTITYGQALTASNLRGGSANTAGTFGWTSSIIQPNAGSAVPESVTFTPTNTTQYSAITNSNINITVNQAATSVSLWPTAAGISSPSPLSASNLSGGTASQDGTFGWTNPDTVPAAGTASYSVTFTPTDSTDYTTVSGGSVSITVNACGLQDIGNTAYSTALDISTAGTTVPLSNPALDAEGTNVSAICAVTSSPVDGTAVTVTSPFITSNAASSYPADSNTNGTNAAVLAYGTTATASQGATITITDDDSGDPSSISTNSNNSSAVFASMGGTVNITDANINTYGNNSYGLDATYGGTLGLTNVTATTTGNNSAVIMSGIGGANAVSSTGGTYTSSGTNAAGVYAAGTGSTVSLNGDTVTAQNWTAVVVEGGNTVTITGGATLSGASGNNHGIFLYEGSSGDATAGTSTFAMTDGSITYICDPSLASGCATGVTSSNQNALATLFSVANTTAIITLTDVALTNTTNSNGVGNGILLTVAALNSGTPGSNGGNVTFNAIGEVLTGDVVVDSISTATISLTQDGNSVPSTLTGAINIDDNAGATVNLTLDATSSWVAGDGISHLTSLNNAGSGNIICQNSGQCSVYVGGVLQTGIN